MPVLHVRELCDADGIVVLSARELIRAVREPEGTASTVTLEPRELALTVREPPLTVRELTLAVRTTFLHAKEVGGSRGMSGASGCKWVAGRGNTLAGDPMWHTYI